MEKGYEIKFWKDWLGADHLKRGQLVKKLLIFKELFQIKDDETLKRTAVILLNSYFEDLESAVYTKINLEENK